MKKIFLFSAVAAVAIAVAGCSEKIKSASNIHDLKQLETQFKKPTKEYRTVPFMVWNAETTKADIDFMLEDYKAKGIGGFFIHPRMGMVTEYFSDEWWELCRYTMERAKALDLETWLYDENGFPSGFAGGHTQREMPESYNQGHSLLMVKMDTLSPDPTLEYTVVLRKDGDKYVNISDTYQSEIGSTGNYYLFKKMFMPNSPRYGNMPYINMMMPGVTQKFIDLTMPGYEKIFGNEFGKSVRGIFCDEPHIRPEVGATWFTDMFEMFEAQNGYRLQEVLPSLFDEVGEWRKIRHDFRKTMMFGHIERWSKPWRRYCDSTGLQWTGHYWEHAWPNPHVTPDNMMMYTFHDVPAIDILFNQYDESRAAGQFGNIRSVREVRSIANQMGRGQTLCEIYAGAGWELSFFDMKRQADWINVLGINTVTQHYNPVSVKGIRKTDYPAVFSYHEPWWPYYGTLAEYHARVNVAMSAGDQVNDILVLEPTTSAWMYFIRGENKVGHKIGEIANGFQEFVTMLETNQVEYDLGSEAVMNEYAKAKGGKMILGERTYSTIVVPPTMENIEGTTLELLKQYVASGGRLLVFGDAPLYIEGSEDARIAEFFGSKDVKRINELTRVVIATDFANENIRFAADVADHGRLFHQRRVMNDGQVVMVVNTDDSVRIAGSFDVKGVDALLLDPITGVITDYPESASSVDGMIKVDYDLYPAGEMILFISDAKTKGYAPSQFRPEVQPVAVGETAARRDADNIMVLDRVSRMMVNGKEFRNISAYDADDEAYSANGFEGGNPWFFSAQYKTEFLDHKFPADGSLSVDYTFDVASGVDVSGLKLVVERPAVWSVKVNGKEVSANKGEWWIDWDFGVYSIGDVAVAGRNTVNISAAPMGIHNEVMAVYVLGDFISLKPNTLNAPAPLAVGSWKGQNLPFYSQSATYSTSFNADAAGDYYEVALGDWNGTVAEVVVNGQSAGIIGWEPYVCDVSSLVKSGSNTVEVKVVGSLKNTFGAFYSKPRGQVSPALMRRGSKAEDFVTYDKYDLFDYGLFEPIKVNKGKK